MLVTFLFFIRRLRDIKIYVDGTSIPFLILYLYTQERIPLHVVVTVEAVAAPRRIGTIPMKQNVNTCIHT